MLRICVLLCFCYTSVRLFGQSEPFFQRVTSAQGLPSHTVYSLNEDHFGRMLLGTEKGLIRYNGIHFTTVVCTDAISKPVTNIVKASDGRFFAHNFSGQLFVYENEQLRLFPLPQLPEEILNIHSKGDSLIVVTNEQALLYNWKKRKLIRRLDPPEKPGERHIASAGFHKNGIYIVYTNGFLRFNDDLYSYPGTDFLSALTYGNHFLIAPLFSKQGNVFELRDGQLHSFAPLHYTHNPKIHAFKEVDGQLFICSQKGVMMIDHADKSQKKWFSDYKITDVHRDKRGNFWFSTLEKGLLYVPNIAVTVLSPLPSLSITRHNGFTFTGDSYGKVHQMDHNGKTVHAFKPGITIIEAGFVQIHNGRLYTNCSVFDLQNGRQLNTSFEFVKHFAADTKGNFYLAKPYGLIRVPLTSIRKKGMEFGITDPEQLEFLTHKRTRDVCIDPHDIVYAACIDGLYAWKDGQRQELLLQGKSIKASALVVSGEKLYVSTFNHGILVFEHLQLTEIIDQHHGLKSETVLKTISSPIGLFILTDEGFYRRNPGSTACHSLNGVLGFQSLQISDFCVDGNLLYFATDQGTICVPVFRTLQEKPAFVLRGIHVNGHAVPLHQLLTVDYSDNDLQIFFEAVAYKNVKTIEYQYAIQHDGRLGKWISLPAYSTSLNLTSLKSGDYRVRFRVYDPATGLYSGERVLRFTISRPWYLSWWALSLLLITALGISSLFWWYKGKFVERRYRREMEQQLLKKDLAEARLTALRAQMNPHFMYNVLNSIQSLVYANKSNEASYYLGKYADLTRRFLELSSRESVTVKMECETIITYLELEKLRFEEDFTYEVNVDPAIDTGFTLIPTLFIQPFVENSLKHGLLHKSGPKKLVISFTQFTDGIRIEIADNGVGRKKSADINSRKADKKTSYATNAVTRKMELLNRDRSRKITLDIHDNYSDAGMPTGTTVVLFIPE